MNALLAHINRFNHWYDNLPGGPRFGLFMALMAAAIVPLQVGLALGSFTMAAVGFTLLCGMTAIGVVRATNMGGKHVLVGVAMVLALGLVGLGLHR